MPHLLDSVWAKIKRAKEHVDNLASNSTEFCESYLAQYKVVGEIDRQASEYRVKGSGPAITVPDDMLVICGEAAYQLRSALDHLIWALVRANAQTPGRHTQFPIFSDHTKFKSTGLGNIKGVSASAENIIRSIQPYTRASPDDSALSILADLNNTDKHRTLVICVNAANIKQMLITNTETHGYWPIKFTMLTEPQWICPTPNGDILCRIGFEPSSAQFEVQPKATCQIAFDKLGTKQIEPVIPSLFQLHDYVVQLIERFNGEFP